MTRVAGQKHPYKLSSNKHIAVYLAPDSQAEFLSEITVGNSSMLVSFPNTNANVITPSHHVGN